jgi:heat shock protein HslJ
MKILYVLLIAVVSLQCSPKLSPDHSWVNQRWVLVELKGVPVQQSESRRDAFINFEAGVKRFSGYGGCNQFSGNYVLEGNTIQFLQLVRTDMSCSDIEFENVFVATLNGIDRYEIRGNEIVLKTRRETMLVLRAK